MAVDNHGFRLVQSGGWTMCDGEVTLERDHEGWRARVDWRTRPTTKALLIEHGLVGRRDGLAPGLVLLETLRSEAFPSAREVCEAVASCLACSSRRSRIRSYSVEGTWCELGHHSEAWRFTRSCAMRPETGALEYRTASRPRRGTVTAGERRRRTDVRQGRILESVRGGVYETRSEALAALRSACDRAESPVLLPASVLARGEDLLARSRSWIAAREPASMRTVVE